MRNTLLALFAAVIFCGIAAPVMGGANADPDLQALMAKVKEKFREGKTNEVDLAEELKGFDALIAKHKGEKTDEVAYIALAKAMVYRDFLHEETRCFTILTQLSADYPDTKSAGMTKLMLERAKAFDRLVVGTNFPDFFVRDTAGNPLGLANYRGDVVLIDFWASWSEPCVADALELTKVREAHHAGGFEIIGINLDKAKAKMDGFLAANKMAWPQIFDEGQNDSKIAPECQLTAVPMNFLLDREGRIIARGLHGDALKQAVAEAVEKK